MKSYKRKHLLLGSMKPQGFLTALKKEIGEEESWGGHTGRGPNFDEKNELQGDSEM